MTKILMVCLGNICRSPLAEGILKSKVDSTQVFVDSAGTAGYHVGDLPDARSINVAKKHGINISDQRSRKFTQQDFKDFDWIYVMDKSNYSNVVSMAKSDKDRGKVRLILKEAELELQEVPDPYYGGADGFEYVFNLIDRASDGIVKRLKHGGG